jgi:hypothetical protein
MSRSKLVCPGSTSAFLGPAHNSPGRHIHVPIRRKCFLGRNSRLWAGKRLIRPPLASIVAPGPISAIPGWFWLLWVPAGLVHQCTWVVPACPPRPTVGPRLGRGPCGAPVPRQSPSAPSWAAPGEEAAGLDRSQLGRARSGLRRLGASRCQAVAAGLSSDCAQADDVGVAVCLAGVSSLETPARDAFLASIQICTNESIIYIKCESA